MKKIFVITFVLLAVLGCNNTESSANKEQTNDSIAIDTIPHIQRIGIKMTKDGGVYTIPCLVNGVPMNFIFDTGASDVCISLTEALFLYKNDYIEDDDLGEETRSRIADGSVASGMRLKIKTIEIGGIVLKDIDAIVSSSLEAPLLLGQSAIQKLGKVEMDGDSLFITGLVEHTQASKTKESNIEYAIPPSTPELSWWDKVLAFLGNEDKVEELCIQAWNAYQNDMPELAMKYCDEAIKIREKSWKPYALKGEIKYNLAKCNDYNVATFDFEMAYKLNKKRQTFYMNDVDSISHQYILERMCWCEAANRQLDKALQNAQEGLSLYPNNCNLMYTISLAYTLNGNYELAEKWADKIKAIRPSMAFYRLGYLYHAQGRLKDAAKQYEKCIAEDPENGGALNNLSNVYMELGYFNRAISLRKQAARKGDGFSQNWLKENGYDW